ncbi:MAG: helix-turn-helix transcriptional regulator [Bryobacteraceae bacterium]|nr:helix-turn-helix transcriptional regulator [Bryobacteraceae bacterium]
MAFTTPVQCELDDVLKLIASRWTPHILWVLLTNGRTRFGALKRAIPGISTKVLTQRLRALEASEFVTRDYVPTIPPEVSYDLSAKGHDLRDTLSALKIVAERWAKEYPKQVADGDLNKLRP